MSPVPNVTPDGWNEAMVSDWHCLFGGCGNASAPEWTDVGPPASHSWPREAISVVEVAAAYYMDNGGGGGQGEGTELEVYALVRFSDGCWGAVEAGTDYTGWGCGDWVMWRVGRDRPSVERFGLTNEGRSRLGITLPEDAS